MSLPFSEQDLGTRYFAMLSSAMLAFVICIAGIALMALEKLGESHPFWQTGSTFEAAGLTGLLAVWFGHLFAMVLLLGYRANGVRHSLAIAIFLAAMWYAGSAMLSALGLWIRALSPCNIA